MMQSWFPAAKLGIFIHWGIYAVDGTAESWAFYTDPSAEYYVPYDQYMTQIERFTAENYNPDEWAQLFQKIGAGYAVLTTKHHDGVALWDTQQNDLSVVEQSPARRDLVRPFVEALRRHGLKTGLYFSHLDWSHPDYASVNHGGAERGANEAGSPFSFPQGAQDPVAWEQFLRFHRAQLRELCTRYQPDLLWFDGDWERTSEQWRMKELRDELHALCPDVVLNSRMGGYGDYDTPEQGVPIQAPPGVWEFCMTMNDCWSYRPSQNHTYKSPNHIIRTFIECVGMGGNLLLNISPTQDGLIPPEQIERLEELGRFNARNFEAIFPTVAGLPHGHLYGSSTLSPDRKTLYAFAFDRPREFAVKGIRNPIGRVTVLGNERELKHSKVGGAGWANIPGVLWIEVPDEVHQPYATVLKIELEGELDLYRGQGEVITSN